MSKPVFDTKRFIHEVEKRPPIWKEVPAKSKEEKHKHWESVGEVMFSNWKVSSQDARNERVREMKLLWKNIEEKFFKDLKNKTPKENREAKFRELLGFLVNKGEAAAETVDVAKPKKTAERKKNVPKANKEGAGEGVKKMPKKKTTDAASERPKEDDNVEDEDSSFFRSIMPVVKRLTHQQKIDLRLDILQSLKKMKIESTKAKSHQPTANKT